MPRTSKKAVGCQKSPWAGKKGREGSHGCLVHAKDINKGLEDGRGLLEGQEGRRGHFKPFFPNSQCRCREPDDFFSRMQGTWLRQVPRILEKKSSGSLHRHCELGKKGLKCPQRPSWPSRRPRPSSRPFLQLTTFFDVCGTY